MYFEFSTSVLNLASIRIPRYRGTRKVYKYVCRRYSCVDVKSKVKTWPVMGKDMAIQY